RFRVRLPSADRMRYLEAVSYTFPMALLVGRLACTLAHDHPGTVTNFPLAVSLASAPARAYIAQVYLGAGRLSELPPPATLASMGFHDLGWYEFLYLGFVVVPITLWLARVQRRTGTFVASFLVLYMPVRFLFDFLRVGDTRYAGLTPAQWVSLIMLSALPVVFFLARRSPRQAGAQADGSETSEGRSI
ncbi:MAG: prolipoprotein diacylglyceryl transferase family protein, partial [Gemmatimonadota bacterium]